MKLFEYFIYILNCFQNKLDSCFWLYINYNNLRILKIKNWHLVSFIIKWRYIIIRTSDHNNLNPISKLNEIRIWLGNELKTVFFIKYDHYEQCIILLR